MLPAHGLGTRTDLPVPVGFAAAVAVSVVLVSLVTVAVLWRTPRLAGGSAGHPLPAGLQRVLDSHALRLGLQTLALLASLGVLDVALVGPSPTVLNLAPYALYVLFWTGLVPLSLLFGPVWKVVNPLRLLHRLLERASGLGDGRGTRPLPARLGWWPAAALLAGFVWLELVLPSRAQPHVVAVALVAYAVVTLVAAQTYGAAWFDRGDGFEAWSTLLGRLSPLGRRADGRLVLRAPLQGLAALPDEPGLAAVVLVLIGSTAFDGVSRSRWWVEHVLPDQVLLSSVGLAASVAAVALLYLAGSAAAGRVAGRRDLPGLFAASLVPIAAGYAVAHYFSLLVFEGQRALVLASDPLRTGADYLGLAGSRVDLRLVSGTTISVVQVAAVTLGHVLAVVLVHDRAVGLVEPRRARRAEVPLGVVMLAFTGGAVALLLAT